MSVQKNNFCLGNPEHHQECQQKIADREDEIHKLKKENFNLKLNKVPESTPIMYQPVEIDIKPLVNFRVWQSENIDTGTADNIN